MPRRRTDTAPAEPDEGAVFSRPSDFGSEDQRRYRKARFALRVHEQGPDGECAYYVWDRKEAARLMEEAGCQIRGDLWITRK